MKELNYLIISPDVVWQWYYDQLGGKHFKELTGKEAQLFIEILKTKKNLYIEDILPAIQIFGKRE